MATEKTTKRRTTSDGMMMAASPKKIERPKPTIRVDENDLPEIKDWKVGKKYNVKATIEMRSLSKGDSYGYDGPGESGEKKKHEATLIVHDICAHDDK